MSPEGTEKRSRAVLIVVFTTILIDFIGFSVLIPVLPLFADRLGATPLQIGLILSLYALAQLLFLPLWGWFSDRVGRRPVLLFSLLGTAASFVLLAGAETIALVYLARILAGFFAASIGTAQAVVTDVTPPAERAGGMGVIGAAFGIGMVVGPMLGGGLARFNEQAPFYAISLLAGLNFILAWFALPESRPPGLPRPQMSDFGRALIPTPVVMFLQVHDRRIALYLLLFFILFTGFAVVEALIPLYLARKFGADELDSALIFAWIGLVLAVTQGVLLSRLVERLGESVMLVIGLALMAVGIALLPAAPTLSSYYLLGPVVAIGTGLAFPSFTSLYTKACRAEEAGELLGHSNSMSTAGRVVGSAGGGALMTGPFLGLPFVVAGCVMAGGLVLFLIFRRYLVRGL
jgi:multidrug resistance protein